jgi:hypothetical protein
VVVIVAVLHVLIMFIRFIVLIMVFSRKQRLSDTRFLCHGGNRQTFQIFALSNGNNHDVFVYLFSNNFVLFPVITRRQNEATARVAHITLMTNT